MKRIMLTTAALMLATAAQAEGDVAAGEKAFGKCKSCHTITTPEGEVLAKGGRTGPNLYGVVGRAAGAGDFKYSKAMTEAGEAGLVWDEALLAAFVADPKGFLKEQGTDGKTKMTFKLKKGGEDVAAYLASVSPMVEVEETEEEAVTQ
ncbi:c-type cytochrome [Cognatishimia maritima]|uniref:Cytochrome c n=1 Tax=Cognatishimia maritima TaxID=870908 RepID=A0A1M5TSM1_9RHOB|nr:cytochrome C [Cognatishimia maritima]SHH53815.1 cytochrome c [Cognatishimia maritima]